MSELILAWEGGKEGVREWWGKGGSVGRRDEEWWRDGGKRYGGRGRKGVSEGACGGKNDKRISKNVKYLDREGKKGKWREKKTLDDDKGRKRKKKYIYNAGTVFTS